MAVFVVRYLHVELGGVGYLLEELDQHQHLHDRTA